jgi:hypothetical protein
MFHVKHALFSFATQGVPVSGAALPVEGRAELAQEMMS